MSKKNNQIRNKMIKALPRNADAGKLDYIQSHSDLNWIREETIIDPLFSTRNKVRIPDLICKGKIPIILEHDSVSIHGELGFENERTKKRNSDYFRSDREFIVINEDLAKMLNLDEANLSSYLYFHQIAQKEAESY